MIVVRNLRANLVTVLHSEYIEAARARGYSELRVVSKHAMRNSVASKSLAKLESDYLDFYRGLYPGIGRERPLRVVDDRETNRLTTYESYSLPADKLRHDKLLGRFPVKASSLDSYDKVPAGERETPYQLATAVNKEHVIVIAEGCGVAIRILATVSRRPLIEHRADLLFGFR